MSRKHTVLLAAAVALSASAATSAGATAATPAPTKQKLAIVGRSAFKINKLAFDNQRFSKSVVRISSGGTIRLTNRAKTQLPKSFDCDVCGEIFAAHGAGDPNGGLVNPVVDVGAPGYDQPGDSTFVAPHARVSFKVTAPAGTTLHFICAIHSWMQGRIKVS